MNPHAEEIKSGTRFEFGANWQRFLARLDPARIAAAEASLREMLRVETLAGRSFLDIGSGSGLFSLAARRLGARVVSFDFDPKSVACTEELRRRYFSDDPDWRIEEGSVLDGAYVESLGQFDIVYSWGVLHHTGAMWQALANAAPAVKPGGLVFIALYNRQQFASTYWRFVKRNYNRFAPSRPVFIGLHLLYPTLPWVLLRLAQRRGIPRGMNVWTDLIDWLGGYPFEVSTPEQVFEFFRDRGYRLEKLRTVGGKMGCNEYVFRKEAG